MSAEVPILSPSLPALVSRRLAQLVFLGALAWVAVYRVLPVQDRVTTSFAGYWVVARAVADGVPVVDLYDDAVLDARMRGDGIAMPDKMIGPPSLTLTLLPLASLPYPLARRVWLWGVCLPALAAATWLLGARIGPRVGPLFAAAFLLSAPVEESLRVGQIYPVFLVLHLLALRGAERGSTWLMAAGAAPMIAVRGWYGVPLAVGWAVMGRWRAAAATVVGAALLVLASVPLVGVASWRHFFGPHLTEMAADPWAGSPGFQTLRSLMLHLTTPDARWGPAPPLDLPGAAPWLLSLVALGLVGFTWRVLRAAPPPDVALAVLTTIELLLSPFTQEYHFLLAALPAAVVLRRGPPAVVAMVLVALVLLLWPFDYQAPSLAGGWASVLAYPRVAGALLLFVATCLTTRSSLTTRGTAPAAGSS